MPMLGLKWSNLIRQQTCQINENEWTFTYLNYTILYTRQLLVTTLVATSFGLYSVTVRKITHVEQIKAVQSNAVLSVTLKTGMG